MAEPAGKRAVRAAFGYSFAHRYGEAALRIALLVVLARHVDPVGFGAFAIAYGLVSLLAGACRDGVSSWIVRAGGEPEPGLGTPFAVVALGAGLCAGCLFALAGPLARLAEAEEAATPLRVLSLAFLALPFEAVFSGVLRRRLAFRRVAVIGVVAVAVGGLLSVALAVAGWGATGLAVGAVAEAAAIAAGSAFAARDAWRSARVPGGTFGEVGAFCLRIGAGSVLAGLGKLTATLAIARFLGPSATGLYDRARRVTWGFGDLVLNAVTPVVLPALAEARRGGGDFAGPYLVKLQALSLAAWPFFAALAVLAEPVVLLLLGPDWMAAVPLVRAACLFGVALPYHVTDAPFLIASGREREYVRIQLITQVVTVALVVVAAQVDVAAVFVAYALAKAVKAALTTAVLARAFGLRVAELVGATARSALVAAGVGVAAFGVEAALPSPTGWPGALAVVATGGVVCAASLVGLAVAVAHPVRAEAGAALRHGAERLGVVPAR